jgi:Sulfotransferase family
MYQASHIIVQQVDQGDPEKSHLQNALCSQIDEPTADRLFVGEYILLQGWCFFENGPLDGMEARWQELELPSHHEFGIERPDVAQAFQNERRTSSGFRFHVFTYCVPAAEFTVSIFVCSEDGAMRKIGAIRLHRREIRRRKRLNLNIPSLSPLAVTAGGRSGTTLLMRYFDAHPQIVVHREYPFERSILDFTLRRFHDLTLPATYRSGNCFTSEIMTHIYRHAPQAYPEQYDFKSEEGRWMTAVQAETAEYSQFCSTDYYRKLAVAQKKRARAFAEKLVEFRHHCLDFLRVFERGQLVILLRDPRDRFLSQQCFDRKRGSDGGWYLGTDGTLGGFLRKLKEEFWLSAEIVRRFSRRVIAIRYEDLVSQPHFLLKTLFERFSLMSGRPVLERVITQVESGNSSFYGHRTSPDPQSSISRWKTELDPEIALAFSTVLREELEAFGYEVDRVTRPPSDKLLRQIVRYRREPKTRS